MSALRLCCALALLAATSSCRAPATGVLVTLETDAPVSRTLEMTVLVSPSGSLATGRIQRWRRGGGVADGITLPASFGIIPARGGARDEAVSLRVDATLAAAAGLPELAFAREVSFRFSPGRTTSVRVFLSVLCAAPATGCRGTQPGEACTAGRLCEEAGMSCAEGGRCVPVPIDTPPLPPDAMVMPAPDATVADDGLRDDGLRDDGARDDGVLDDSVLDDSVLDDGVRDATPEVDAPPADGVVSPDVMCASGMILCSGVCVAGNTPMNCGTCGRVCVDVPNGVATCVAGACSFVCGAGYIPSGAMCVPVTPCGNRALDPAEQCDDGNTLAGDGCTPTCRLEATAIAESCSASAANIVISGTGRVVYLGSTIGRANDGTGGAVCGADGPDVVMHLRITAPSPYSYSITLAPTGFAWDAILRGGFPCPGTVCANTTGAGGAEMFSSVGMLSGTSVFDLTIDGESASDSGSFVVTVDVR